jgi:hypothetical protein
MTVHCHERSYAWNICLAVRCWRWRRPSDHRLLIFPAGLHDLEVGAHGVHLLLRKILRGRQRIQDPAPDEADTAILRGLEFLEAIQQLSGTPVRAKSRPGRVSPISLVAKQTGERRAGKSARCVRRGGDWKRGMVEML